MLMQRVVTALVLLPLLLGLVAFAPTTAVYAVFALAGAVIAWEWAGLLRGSRPLHRYVFAAVVAALLALAWWSPLRTDGLPVLLGLSCLWWLYAPTLFFGFPARYAGRPLATPLMLAAGALLIVSTILALAWLHAQPDGTLRLLYVLFLVFAADTGAYLAGRTLGRHKLAPTISPGKTIEGAAGGLLLAAAWALTAGVWVFRPEGADILAFLALSMLAAAASIVGDLLESMFKRLAGIKDSGHILPGHGGVLDRVDSILAAAPVMVLGLVLLEL